MAKNYFTDTVNLYFTANIIWFSNGRFSGRTNCGYYCGLHDSSNVLELLSEVKINKRSTNKFHSNFKKSHLQAIMEVNKQLEGDFLWQNIRKN